MDNMRRDFNAEHLQQPIISNYTSNQAGYQFGNAGYNENLYKIQTHSNSQSSYSREPENVLCPFCKNFITTRVVHTRGVTAWVLCAILCVFCFPFCIYPLICTPCLDTRHICPHCENELANIPMI